MQPKKTQHRLPFGSDATIQDLCTKYGTPLFIHDENSYRRQGRQALDAPNAYGLTVRYAMKANPHGMVLRIFDRLGIEFDASSSHEVKRALAAGIAPQKIQLTSQKMLDRQELKEIVEMGVIYNGTSLEQLRLFADLYPGHVGPLSVRINPGLGSGHNKRTNTAGQGASFGIWHEYLPEVLAMAHRHRLTISRLHTHVGSGSDWRIWQKAAQLTLDLARHFPDVERINLGGGFKIERMNPERSIDLQKAFRPVKRAFEGFAQSTCRRLGLEIEPGTYLAANPCILVARIDDIVDTGAGGYRFLKIDASMTELLRPMIYGARHPIRLLDKGEAVSDEYVVVGTCCESGDIFTPKEGDPEGIDTIMLPPAERGDFVAIMGAGAYGSAMSAKNYNSRPICAEVMILADGSDRLITSRQRPEDMWARELTD